MSHYLRRAPSTRQSVSSCVYQFAEPRRVSRVPGLRPPRGLTDERKTFSEKHRRTYRHRTRGFDFLPCLPARRMGRWSTGTLLAVLVVCAAARPAMAGRGRRLLGSGRVRASPPRRTYPVHPLTCHVREQLIKLRFTGPAPRNGSAP
jgi:hypothetical protein